MDFHYYRCCDCRQAFRAEPNRGDDPHKSLQQLAGLTWALGLSFDEVVTVFESLDAKVNWDGIWLEGKEMITHLPEGRRSKLVEITSSKPWSGQGLSGVLLALEMKRGKAVFLKMLHEDNPLKIQEWLEPIIHELGLEIDFIEYRGRSKFYSASDWPERGV